MEQAAVTQKPNTELLEQYRASRRLSDPKLIKMVSSPFMFNMYLLSSLPMGFIAGLKVKSVSAEKCEITVPYRWLNTNPFKSTYFAVLSMAAEMSTGMACMIATRESSPSVSMLVTRFEGEFVKKATGLTTFTCSQGKEINDIVEKTILTGEPQDFLATSIGTSLTGEVESRFYVQWSFKMRSRK
jgi:hypothetical protein